MVTTRSWIWRRSYDVRPPALEESDPRYPGSDPRYRGLPAADLPLTECLEDTVARFLPYWHAAIVPALQSGKKVIIAAHGNSLRALVKHLDHVSDQDIVGLNIPTGVPLVYELDDELIRCGTITWVTPTRLPRRRPPSPTRARPGEHSCDQNAATPRDCAATGCRSCASAVRDQNSV